MTVRKWIRHKEPGDPVWKTHMTLGDRNVELPPGALVSVTYLKDLNAFRGILNGLTSLAVMSQMTKTEGLFFAEIYAAEKGRGHTLTVWAPKAMVPFRDQKRHGWVMRYMSWIFFGGKCQAYFLTWLAKGRIPTPQEIPPIVFDHAKHYDGGNLVRQASRPEWGPVEAAGAD